MYGTILDSVFRAFFVHRDRGLTVHELADHVYRTADGGPLDTTNCLRTHVHRLNKHLIPLGWKIAVDGCGHGGKGVRRRLQKI
jgi:hypothetical protein